MVMAPGTLQAERLSMVFKRQMKILSLLAAGLVTASLSQATITQALAQAPQLQGNSETGETPAQFAKRTQWWRDAKFGLFIHWGV